MVDSVVRLGVVGLGNIGRQHIKNIQQFVSGCELSAICARKRVDIPGAENAQFFSDYQAMIDSGVIDAVLIATPTMAHLTQGLYALQRGLHVLMEKPIGLSIQEGEQLLDASGSHVFALMLNQRADPLFLTMKARLPALGEIQRTHWTMTNWFRPEVYFQVSDWRATWKGEGGGMLVNQCIHNLDIFQWICGMPSELRGFCEFGKYHSIEVEDEASAFFRYKNGASGVFIGSTGEAPGVNRFDIIGNRGTLSFDGERLMLKQNSESSAAYCRNTRDMFGMPECVVTDITPERNVNQHVVIIQNFINAIRSKEKLIAPAREGLNSLALANAILLSAWDGMDVFFPLDSARFQAALEQRIAHSVLRNKVDIVANIDMDKSYR